MEIKDIFNLNLNCENSKKEYVNFFQQGLVESLINDFGFGYTKNDIKTILIKDLEVLKKGLNSEQNENIDQQKVKFLEDEILENLNFIDSTIEKWHTRIKKMYN